MIAIKSKYLISSADEIYTNYAVVVENDIIKDILPNEEVEIKYKNTEEIIDKSDAIIMPGFVNGHMHQYGVLSRGIPANVHFTDFEGFLNDYWWPFIENRIGLKEVKATTKASAIELIESGVVAFCDTLEAPNTEEGTLIEQGKILEEIGMKAILSLESCERISFENGLRCLDENSNLIKWSRENSKLINGIMCTHTSFTCSDRFIKKAKEDAKKLNAPMQFHLCESIYEPNYAEKHFGKKAVDYYNDLDILDETVLASQCVKVNDEEIDILKEKGVKVVHMPLSNCEVGGGFSPVPKMIKKGIKVALGTDGYINDFFEVMRGAFLMHKSVEEDASVMPANLVFRMATEHGAYVLGLQNSGKIAVGNKADIIVMEDEFKTPVTLDNIFDQIVVQGKKEFISNVYIDGRHILKEKQLVDLDKKAIVKEMKEVACEFWKF
ncbi:amidohydrolase family protein [Clostridioides difficile]|uniref:amidohydrolase family protein n=1 Tax=Clostridioides difficile TaxID=1496 RepID=UPI0010BB3EA5|nr:amidohydrolase family protein [Clostridioides difficile]MCM4143010.1 amidohydrolase family protein [Clostridioides difficile]MDU2172378.1 amidohydrolase family protein [Clostridioides difficile]NJA21378.1 amidohydrolase family protein [Clostridioides difficile]NKC26574.1 amidohydrolase family protein [Clostridioides difficile]VHX86246.1 S-adenosylhomocysteine deaminase [Clostridioides difficile]